MAGNNSISGQTDSGRYYNNATELRQASGRAVRFFLYLARDDLEIGRVLMRRQWMYGHINAKAKGPKKWEAEIERKLDDIVKRALTHFRKEEGNAHIELVAIEGWKICEPRIQPRVKDSFRIVATDRSQDRSTKIEA